jgi:hypothetical protein
MKENNPNLQLISAANGTPTAGFTLLDGRHIYLHSRFDPEAEARFLVKTIPIRERTLYVVLGFGMGYHVKELLGRIPQSSYLLVVESVTEHLSRQMKTYCRQKGETWIQDKRLIFHSHYDPETVPIFLADAFIRLRTLSLHIFTHIPSASTNEAFYRWVLKEIQTKFSVFLEGHLGANDRILENNLSNFWTNLSVTWQTPHVSCLSGRWQRHAAVLVAAGPSLTPEIEKLRKLRNRALIISVGTAARILMKHGIAPDFVVSVDPFEVNLAHFKDWNTDGIPLIYYHRIWREIPSTYKGPKFWFAMDEEPPVPLTGIQGASEFWRGGTVAFTALQFAHYLETDPIILVGLDFAFHDGCTHAEGAVYGGKVKTDTLREGFFRIPGVSGEQVVTNQSYYSYLLYLQDYIQRHPNIRHINTSTMGAKIHGTIESPLENALDRYGGNEKKETMPVVRDVFRSFKPVSSNTILKMVCQWEQEMSRFINKNKDESRLDPLISNFKKLSIYKQISSAYDDCFFTWEIQKIRKRSQSEARLCERILEHCGFIIDQLRVIRDDR